MTQQGWAVIDADKNIHIKTVSDTRRAAIVNWLCVVKRIWVSQLMTTAQIEEAWQKLHGDAAVVKIEVRRLEA